MHICGFAHSAEIVVAPTCDALLYWHQKWSRFQISICHRHSWCCPLKGCMSAACLQPSPRYLKEDTLATGCQISNMHISRSES